MKPVRNSLMLLLAAGCLGGCAGSDEPVQQPVSMAERNPVQYPVSMWDRGVEGESVLMVHVNEHGDVDSVYVEKSSGQEAFDSAATAGARNLRFTPGRRGERSIAMWTRLPIRFALDSTATLGVPTPADEKNP